METVSALAVLSPAKDEAQLDRARQELRDLGFEVYPGGPVALTINAGRDRFESVFDVRLKIGQDGQAALAGDPATIPPQLAPYVDRVEFPTRHETFP